MSKGKVVVKGKSSYMKEQMMMVKKVEKGEVRGKRYEPRWMIEKGKISL